jgi:phosphoenolpyruvate phosphomutase
MRGTRPAVLAGAHDGLTARLVEEAGFDAVWASGFEISASHGVPDASILTMTDLLAAARQMRQATTLPIVADCDGGFGNAINVIHMVRVYEQAGVTALCIEDRPFPKRCSFYDQTGAALTPVDEQALKIRAACEARADRDTVIIARTEALVLGAGVDEALARAHAYADAGADALLIHSNRPTAEEVLAFARAWTRPLPLVAVPTTYADADLDTLWAGGFRMVIFANHGLRAAIRSVRETLCELRASGRARSVEDRIATLGDVFKLVRLDQMRDDESRYVAPAHSAVR